MSALRILVGELAARAQLTWPARVLPPPAAIRQIALPADREALAATPPSRPITHRELSAARALLSDRRTAHEDAGDPEPIDVEVLLALAPKEAFQLRQLFAVRPALARGAAASWDRVDAMILARQGLEAAGVVASRPASALFVRDASLVPAMVSATREPRTAGAGRAWLVRHADLVAAWAVRATFTLGDRDAGAAALAFLNHAGKTDVVSAALARSGAEAELRPILDRPYFPGLPYVLSGPSTLPDALVLTTTDGVRLARDERDLIVRGLGSVGPDESALVQALRDEIGPRALGDLALALFEAWREDRVLAAWVLHRAAELGDGRMTRVLSRTHRAFSAKRDPRAPSLLDALARCGTELSIFELGRVAEGEHATARAQARKLLQPIAEERDVTVDRLIERTLPHLGLDARGERLIEGPVEGRIADIEGWSLIVTPTLDVVFRRPGGDIVAQPPRGKAGALHKSEASELAAEVRAVATRANKRLERAMCDARPLSRELLDAMIAHPVLLRVVQSLVWQDEDGARFRIAEDRTAASLEEETRPLPSAWAKVVHSVTLDPEERARWRELLQSYELVPPFLQLERRVHTLTDAQRSLEALSSRFFATRVRTLMARGFRLDWGGDELLEELPDGHTLRIALSPRFDPRINPREQGELDAVATVHRGDQYQPLGVLAPAVASELLDLMPPRP